MDESSSDSAAERLLSIVPEVYNERQGSMDSSKIIPVPGGPLTDINKRKSAKKTNNSKCTSLECHPDINSRPHHVSVQIDCACNKENLDRHSPVSNQCVVNNNCDNLMSNLSINPITKNDENQDQILQDTVVVGNESEPEQPPQPELTVEQRQRIQDFIDSIKPEYCTSLRNNSSSADEDSNVTSTTATSLNRGQYCTSPLQVGFVAINTSSSYLNQGTVIVGDNTLSNSSEDHNEEAIMGYVDRLIASEEHNIQQEVEERFGRMLQNQRSARDSLTSAVNANDNVFDDEMVVDSSVEIISVTPAAPHTLDTSDEVVILSNNDSDVEILNGPCTSAGVRNTRRRKAEASKQPCKRRRRDATTKNENNLPTNAVNTNATPNQNSILGTRECPICLDQLQLKEISSTVCGHVFCTTCIKAAIKSSKTCPNCRTKLTLKKIHPLFL
ncbi:hypothetical protein RN001_013886 [Aquatica leii]|uniref:RING-type domain-containing protein n=1 Tax=Aquatica leii TaxID=1421715 RepID=A0AAN7P387_9COLE|nr:hypothetical protein RN001_013886 [Aquatica leii]